MDGMGQELVVTPLLGKTPRDLVNVLVGCGIIIDDVAFKGSADSAGTFSGGASIIGFDSGVILSSGRVSSVIGPNVQDGISNTIGTGTDADLQALIPGFSVEDVTVLEFDFIPSSTTVSFDYVFASDEYNEYVYSSFNDVFGFFLNGANVALVPGTALVVSIDNVNGGNPYGDPNASYPQYYINNDTSDGGPFLNTEMDGLTVVFTVTATVNANEVNRIRLGVGDAGDTIFDSNVFIRAGSFASKCVDATAGGSMPMAAAAAEMNAYPNPFRPGSGGGQDAAEIAIRNIPPCGVVRIYTTRGALVRELYDSDCDGRVMWDAKSGTGHDAASGVYLVMAKGSDGSRHRTKVVIVR